MYTECSEQFKTAVKGRIRSCRGRLAFKDFYIYGLDSVTMTKGSQSGDDITVGSVVAPSIKITLTETAESLVGREFTYEMGVLSDIEKIADILPNDAFEYIPMARFTVKSLKKNGAKYECEAYHKLSLAGRKYKSALRFPTTAENILQEACNSLGLTLRTVGLPVKMVEALPEGTARDVIGWCAGLYGMFVAADRSDGVVLKWYEDSGKTIPLYAQDEPEINESDIEIGALKCTVGDDSVYTFGEGHALIMTNPLVTPQTFSELVSKLTGFKYRPCTLNMRLGDPLLDVWDIVTIEYEGGVYKVPVTEITHSFAGGLTSTVIANGDAEADQERQSSVDRIVNRIVRTAFEDGRSDIQRDIEQAIIDATEAIRGGANGYFHIITDEDGVNRETIWCDNIDPLLATHGIRINRAGIGFWSKELEPERNIFNGTYTNAWTIDGSLIADFIRAGTLRGIRIECDNGLIAGWSITSDSMISPDGSLKLESTNVVPRTTHKWLRDNGFTHKMLRKYTHRQIRYLLSVTVGVSQISSTNGREKMVIKSGGAWFYSGDVLRMKLDISGQKFYDEDGNHLGYTGTNYLATDPSKKGIVFDLDYEGDYMSWAVRETSGSDSYSQIFAYYRESDSFSFSRPVRIEGLASLSGGILVPNDKDVDFYSPINMHNWAIIDSHFESSSDEKLKKNITDCTVSGLDVINALRLISFDWIADGKHEDIGFSAQQVGVIREDLQGSVGETLTVNEGRLIRYLVKAVQELSAELEELKYGKV